MDNGNDASIWDVKDGHLCCQEISDWAQQDGFVPLSSPIMEII